MAPDWQGRRSRRPGGSGGGGGGGNGAAAGYTDAQLRARNAAASAVWQGQWKGGATGMEGATGMPNGGVPQQESPVAPVVSLVREAADAIGLTGELNLFGSYVNGMFTGNSDCDLSYMPAEGKESEETAVWVLQRFAMELPKYGFTSIIPIFQASIPLVKAIDPTGKEVDLCVGNRLGFQNSKLIAAYYGLDPRVGELGKLVKKWAKSWELVGSSDGHLNSYAYTLLSIYYLMHTESPVVPNLQALAIQDGEPEIVRDRRWGREYDWDCKFWQDIHLIPKSSNRASVDELLLGFFEYYTTPSSFDWLSEAVSIRLARTPAHLPGAPGARSKFNLLASPQVAKEQWYVEDPFDLRHNLASQCTKDGRARIMKKMRETREVLTAKRGEGQMKAFLSHCEKASEQLPSIASAASKVPTPFLLKCRVHAEKVTREQFEEALSSVGDVEIPFVVKLPSGTIPVAEAFLLFAKESDRRKVHRLNETYVGEWQLRLLPCCSWALEDSLSVGTYEELEITPKPLGPNALPEDHEKTEAQAREEVRTGLKVSTNETEVRVLMQRALALGLQEEEELAKKRLSGLPGFRAATPKLAPSLAPTLVLDPHAPAAAELAPEPAPAAPAAPAAAAVQEAAPVTAPAAAPAAEVPTPAPEEDKPAASDEAKPVEAKPEEAKPEEAPAADAPAPAAAAVEAEKEEPVCFQ